MHDLTNHPPSVFPRRNSPLIDAPKEIFKCDVIGCEQKFVRSDLLARHKKRHSTSYMPRNRVPSFNSPKGSASALPPATISPSPSALIDPRPPLAVPHDAAILLGPQSAAHPHPGASLSASSTGIGQPHSGWSATVSEMAAVSILGHPKTGYYHSEHQSLPGQPPADLSFGALPDQGTFTNWLFDRHGLYGDFNAANMPFLEGGLESTFNSNIHYDYESLTSSRSQLETPPRLADSDELMSDYRRQEIVHWLQTFCQRQPKWKPLLVGLVNDSGDDWPGLEVETMHDWLQEYWDFVSPRMPIVHQPTFSCNRCSVFLLLVMLALGATSLRRRSPQPHPSDCGHFADFVVDCVRWEIVVQEEASPPVGLWVAQSLLLLEFYEKLFSLRRLHERAHIYHTATLTLLRRGSPLIGRSGSESPPEEQASADTLNAVGVDSRTAWIRWADTEAMHRVVFAAFMMDIIHATMFGHAADMAPHEIRLPLPCDDNLWTAQTPEVARQLESNLRMYGIKPVSFLDGLKKALHGKEVSTLSFGRMIIMSGLLSLGWHISHRETHLKWLDLHKAGPETHDSWKELVLAAFDNWKESYDAAQGVTAGPTSSDQESSDHQRSAFNGPIQSAAALYHLAHISLHVDIVDCQVYAGAKRILGRRVSTRDYANVVSRMDSWSRLPSTRHAVLHAFKLLHRILVDPRFRLSSSDSLPSPPSFPSDPRNHHSRHTAPLARGPLELASLPNSFTPDAIQPYSCRADPDPHRPWIMYHATLAIWSYAHALTSTRDRRQSHSHSVATGLTSVASPAAGRHATIPSANIKPLSTPPPVNYPRVAAYLRRMAALSELVETEAPSLITDGLPDLLDALRGVLADSQWELLQEADERLRVGKEILLGDGGG